MSRLNCPTCQKPLIWSADNPWRPFCCERCKLIDLGEWASGERRIAGNPLTEDDIIDLDDIPGEQYAGDGTDDIRH